MPDEIATRATLLLMGGIVAGLTMAPVVAWIWRWLARAKSGASIGIAAGLALFGAGMAWVSVDMAAVVLAREGQVRLRGEFQGFESVTLRESPRSGQKLKGAAPLVGFVLPDGSRHQLRGLSGSLQGLQPGDAVPVRVDPRDPAGAVIEDFQNMHAALALFALFGVLALLGTLHNVAQGVIDLREERAAASKGRGRRPAPAPSRFMAWRDGTAGQHWRTSCQRSAIGALVLGVASLFVLGESMDVARAFAIALAAVAVSLLMFGAAAALKAGEARPLMRFSGFVIGAVGFGGFAAMLWLLSGPAPAA